MNVAVSLSQGDWLMRVDGDDILHPDRVRLTALAIQKYPQATAISGKLHPFSGTPQIVTNPKDQELEYIVADYNSYKNGHCLLKGVQWWGCMMTVSRRIFQVFGNLPKDCGIMDDTFFASRALMLGQFVIIKNGYLLYYRRHEGNISSFSEKNNLRKKLRLFLLTGDVSGCIILKDQEKRRKFNGKTSYKRLPSRCFLPL
jgi:hypothetical protein